VIRALYTLTLSILALLSLPLLPFLALHPRWRKGLPERLGWLPRATRRLNMVHQGSLWIHAASLGEVNAIAPVVRELLARSPTLPFFFTHTSPSGRQRARELFPDAAACLFLPLDLPWLLRPLFKRFQPRFALVAETELWPNLAHAWAKAGCQAMLANARMSARSLRRYQWFHSLFFDTLNCFELIACQSQADAERYRVLGARPSRLSVSGNTKYDIGSELEGARQASKALAQALGLQEAENLIVAASTRPGDEAMVLEAFGQMKKARLLIAPRHPERFDEVAALIQAQGFGLCRRSQAQPSGKQDVVLLDSLGELKAAYALAKLAWVGGGWSEFGGQNPMEPAALGVPVFFGPDMSNFQEAAQRLLDAGAAQVQADAASLAKASQQLLNDEGAWRKASQAGRDAIKKSAGASARVADLAWKLFVLRKLKQDERIWRDESLSKIRRVTEFGSVNELGEDRL